MDQIINRATVCKICYNPREIRAAAVEMNKSFKYEARFFFLSFMDETSARESHLHRRWATPDQRGCFTGLYTYQRRNRQRTFTIKKCNEHCFLLSQGLTYILHAQNRTNPLTGTKGAKRNTPHCWVNNEHKG
jgi:hypothetical protein